MNLKSILLYVICIMTILFISDLRAQNIASRCYSTGYTEILGFDIVNSTVKYAENFNILQQNQSLFMNIFEPAEDTSTYRPAIILAFGGSFITGNRNDLNELCGFFASHGYVAVTIDYRLYNLIFGLDMGKYTETILGAMSDMKAAVRYLKIDAAIDNFYRVDTNAIFVGGYSAGAFTALNTGYLDEDDITPDLPDYILSAYEKLGSIEGNTGEPSTFSYSSKVAGVLNLSGALLDSSFIDAGEPMLMSMHGTLDQTVSFGAGMALNLFPVHGSSSCHNRAVEELVPSYLYPVVGGDHTSIYNSPNYEMDRLNFYSDVLGLMNDKICENVTVSSQEIVKNSTLKLFPNPVQNHLNIISDSELGIIEFYNLTGNKVVEYRFTGNVAHINTSGFLPGVYVLIQSNNEGRQTTQKIVIQN